ncbi:hypothetical protein AAG570_004149 [Ranatra chinensis]|uniref:ZAD domain-containing protein n=1 Tax=Ranatra chinensis TaxID=642074 RepID=A0ABD0Y307_9HEMI
MKVEYSKMASVGIPLSEFRELCRLCGSKTSVLMGLHIFEREGDLRQIYKKITACLPVQVHNTDKLPKMVCEECVYNLDALFDFRERSMKTEYELNSMLKEVYQPVCGESMQSIQMDPLICDSPTTTNGLQVQTTVEVNN